MSKNNEPIPLYFKISFAKKIRKIQEPQKLKWLFILNPKSKMLTIVKDVKMNRWMQ